MEPVLMLLFAYLLGAIPTGYLAGSFFGVDVRQTGSGNVGATNVARVLGKRLGLVTLIVDVAKGFFPVLVSSRLGFDPTVTALVALAAFLGHLYPIFLRFKGGKGVATALGVFLGITPLVAAILALLFALVVSISRRVSLASMAAAGAAPALFWFLSYPPLLVGLSTTMALLVLFRHHENIRRLISGTEPRFEL